MSHVGGPVGHRVVGVRVGQPGTGSFHQNDAQTELFGGAPTEKRKLAPATGRAVEPQHHLARRITVFCIAQSTAVGQVQASFGAGPFNAWHADRVSPGVRDAEDHELTPKSVRTTSLSEVFDSPGRAGQGPKEPFRGGKGHSRPTTLARVSDGVGAQLGPYDQEPGDLCLLKWRRRSPTVEADLWKDAEMPKPVTQSQIVVGVDGSPASRVAVEWAARDAALRN